MSSVVVYSLIDEGDIAEPEAAQQFQSTASFIPPEQSAHNVLTDTDDVTLLIDALAANEKSPPGIESDNERDWLLRKLAELNPSTAIELANRATGERGLRFAFSVLDVWSRNDFSGAWLWSKSAGPNLLTFRKTLLASVSPNNLELAVRLAREWSASQPALAVDIAVMVTDALVGAEDYVQAMKFAQTGSLGVDERESLLRDIANTWTAANPTEASTWALTQKAGAYDVVLPAVVDSWLNTDPFYAVEFVNSLPASPSRAALMQEAVTRWLAIDQTGATHWLMAADPRAEFDRAIFSYATANDTERDNPDRALFWARRITDSELKIAAVRQILSDLKLSNHPQADVYLQNANDLPDEDRENLKQITATSS